MIHVLQMNLKKKTNKKQLRDISKLIHTTNFSLFRTTWPEHTKVWALFVELQIMLKCVRWPGQSGLSCPSWQILRNISVHIRTALPSCSDIIRKSLLSSKQSKLTGVNAQQSKEQVLLNVKLAKDHLSCASSHLRKRWKPRFEPFSCYKPRPRLWSPEDWCHARVAYSSAVGRALPMDHTAATQCKITLLSLNNTIQH